ncbi:MAG: hypothetical protein H8E17_05175 [Deltaproteobacteria bacterium]|nr:hypothetical protein [Deltaproteobacteria bacterium]
MATSLMQAPVLVPYNRLVPILKHNPDKPEVKKGLSQRRKDAKVFKRRSN